MAWSFSFFGASRVAVLSHLYSENSLKVSLHDGEKRIRLDLRASETLRMPSTTSFFAGMVLKRPCLRMHSRKLAADGSAMTASMLKSPARASRAA